MPKPIVALLLMPIALVLSISMKGAISSWLIVSNVAIGGFQIDPLGAGFASWDMSTVVTVVYSPVSCLLWAVLGCIARDRLRSFGSTSQSSCVSPVQSPDIDACDHTDLAGARGIGLRTHVPNHSLRGKQTLLPQTQKRHATRCRHINSSPYATHCTYKAV